jgi:hypothetical protein
MVSTQTLKLVIRVQILMESNFYQLFLINFVLRILNIKYSFCNICLVCFCLIDKAKTDLGLVVKNKQRRQL